jgi:hypothetical protein
LILREQVDWRDPFARRRVIVLICDPKELFLVLVFFFVRRDPKNRTCQVPLLQVFLSLEVLNVITKLGVELPLDIF